MPQVKSPLGHPQSTAHLNRTDFRLSQNFKFTSGVGQYLPVFFDIAQPNEEYSMNFELFSRNMNALLSPAQTVVDEFIEVYFVPFGRLSSYLESMMTKVNDVKSSLLHDNIDSHGTAELNEDLIPLFDFNAASGLNNLLGSFMYGYRFDSVLGSAYRLADMLGYNPNEFIKIFFPGSGDDALQFDGEDYFPLVNLLPFYAYQAIYHDCNRLTNWEQMNAYCSNMDYIQSTPNSTVFIDDVDDPKSIAHLLQIRYRAYNRDFFKAIEANPIFQENSTLQLNFEDFQDRNYINNSAFGLSTVNPAVGFVDQFSGDKRQIISITDTESTDTAVNSVNAIKSLFALDKMARAIGMNAKHYDDQILARFGVKVPRDWRHEIQKIGEYHGTINIGEVIATAATGNEQGGNLGDLAGRAYGKGNGGRIKFSAPCHGVIMALYSSAPRINYIQGTDRLNTIHNFYDFPQPELDNLGLQPMFGYEGFSGTYGATSPTSLVGWRARYMEFKSKPNRATRAFREDYSSSNRNGIFRDWTIAKHPWDYVASLSNVPLRNLLVSPHDMDSLFEHMYRTTDLPSAFYASTSHNYANEVYAYDTFEHDLQINCFKRSWMSTFGVEQL